MTVDVGGWVGVRMCVCVCGWVGVTLHVRSPVHVCVCVTLCSSVKPFEKREGGGAHNWGTVDDELKAS